MRRLRDSAAVLPARIGGVRGRVSLWQLLPRVSPVPIGAVRVAAMLTLRIAENTFYRHDADLSCACCGAQFFAGHTLVLLILNGDGMHGYVCGECAGSPPAVLRQRIRDRAATLKQWADHLDHFSEEPIEFPDRAAWDRQQVADAVDRMLHPDPF